MNADQIEQKLLQYCVEYKADSQKRSFDDLNEALQDKGLIGMGDPMQYGGLKISYDRIPEEHRKMLRCFMLDVVSPWVEEEKVNILGGLARFLQEYSANHPGN